MTPCVEDGLGKWWPLEFSRWQTNMGAMVTVLIWVLGWQMAVNLTHMHREREKWHIDPLFKYHLVFITQTYTRALAAFLQLHSHYFTTSSVLSSFHKLSEMETFSCHETSPGSKCSIMAGRELAEAHFGHRWLNHSMLLTVSLTLVTSVYDSKETTFT